MTDEMLEFEGEVVRETDAAFLFRCDDDGEEYWLPKSQCEWDDLGTMSIPKWLAVKKELV